MAETPLGSPVKRSDLDRSLVTGVAWSGAAKWAVQGFTWLSTLVVARLLTPADYGVVGMAALYLGLVTLTTEFGIGSAVVTLKHLDREHHRQLNAVAVIVAVLGLAVSLLLAIPLARFFREPRLAAVVAALSIGNLLSGFMVVPTALLRAELRFRLLATLEAAQAGLAALLTVPLAVVGLGYWALVWGRLAGTLFQVAGVCFFRRESFSLPRRKDMREALSFSRDVLVGRLSWFVYQNADFLAAGKLLGTSALGTYTLAWNLATAPLEKLMSVIGRVTPAVLAAVQHDVDELRRYNLRITEAISIVVFPAAIGLAMVADDFVTVVLGQKWLGAVVPLRILAAYACVRAISPLWFQVLMVTGDTRFSMRVALIGAALLPLGFAVGTRWGIVGIAVAWVLVHPPVIVAPILGRFLKRVDLDVTRYLSSLTSALKGVAVMAACVAACGAAIPVSRPATRLALQVTVGVVAYGAVVTFSYGARLKGIFRLAMPKRQVMPE